MLISPHISQTTPPNFLCPYYVNQHRLPCLNCYVVSEVRSAPELHGIPIILVGTPSYAWLELSALTAAGTLLLILSAGDMQLVCLLLLLHSVLLNAISDWIISFYCRTVRSATIPGLPRAHNSRMHAHIFFSSEKWDSGLGSSLSCWESSSVIAISFPP